MVAAPVLRSIGQHLHPVGNLTVSNMALNPAQKLISGSLVTNRTNLMKDGSIEGGSMISEFGAYGGATISFDNTYAWSGTTSLKCVTNSSVSNQGFIFIPNVFVGGSNIPSGTPCSMSLYFRATAGSTWVASFRAHTANGSSYLVEGTSPFNFTATGGWQLIKVENATYNGAAFTPGIQVVTTPVQNGISAWADHVIVETGVTTSNGFFNGDYPTAIRKNLCLNPNLNNGSPNTWASQWFGGGAGNGITTVAPKVGYFGGYGWVKQCTVPGNSSQDTGASTRFIPVTPGKQYTISAYVRSDGQSQPFECDWQFLDASGTSISYGQGTPIAASMGTWQRPSVTTTAAPANAAYMNAICGPYQGAFAPWVVGATLTVSNFLVEETTVLGSYFDGTSLATPQTNYQWLGPAGNSISAAGDAQFSYQYSGARLASASTESRSTLANYNLANCSFTRDPNNAAIGNYAGRVQYTSTAAEPLIQQTFAVTPLQNYAASLSIKIPSALSSSISILGYVYAADGTPVTGVDGVTPMVLGGVAVGAAATNGFVRTSIIMTAPVGAATIVLSIQPTNQPTSLDLFYIGNVQFEPSSIANPYVDGDMSGYCWSGAKGTSTTLSTGFPTSFRAFMVGPLAGAQGGMTAKSSMFPGPNVNTLQS